mgnify:FL=1
MKNWFYFWHLSSLITLFFVFFSQTIYASYENYGSKNDVDFLLIPETFTWRQYPRVWTVIKFNNNESMFSLIYSLEEADCSNGLLRNLSQTWVKRKTSSNSRIDQNRRVKLWREINQNKFEDNLHTFLCTYTPPKKENNSLNDENN